VVPDTGETLRTGAYRPLNVPEPLPVAEDASGQPAALTGRHRQAVVAVEDEWRIDDEWWRREPVARHYFTVRLASGQRLVLYKDLAAGGWYRQSY
jgi:hypothetical protein